MACLQCSAYYFLAVNLQMTYKQVCSAANKVTAGGDQAEGK